MQLFPRVYLGNKYDASNPDFINSNHIYHVLNVTDDIKNHFQDVKQVPYKRELEERGLRRINELVDEDSLEEMSQKSLNGSLLSASQQQDEQGTPAPEANSSSQQDTPSNEAQQLSLPSVGSTPTKDSDVVMKDASSLSNQQTPPPSSTTSTNATSSEKKKSALAHNLNDDIVQQVKENLWNEYTEEKKAALFSEGNATPNKAQTEQSSTTASASKKSLSKKASQKKSDLTTPSNPSFMQPDKALRMEYAKREKLEFSNSYIEDPNQPQPRLDPVYLTPLQPLLTNQHPLTLQTPKKSSSQSSTPKKTHQHEIVSIQFSHPVTYKRISIKDSHDANIMQYFDEAADFIDAAIKTHMDEDLQSSCLVHCREGKSRSVSCLIAYAIKKLGWTLEKAYNHVENNTHHRIRVNDGFKRQLMRYEKQVFPELEECTLDFFPKNRGKRTREYADLYEIGAEYEFEEDSQGNTKRRRVDAWEDDDMAWTPELEKRRRRQQMGLLKFLNVNHAMVQDDGKRQITLFEMFNRPKQKKEEKTTSPEPTTNAAEPSQEKPPLSEAAPSNQASTVSNKSSENTTTTTTTSKSGASADTAIDLESDSTSNKENSGPANSKKSTTSKPFPKPQAKNPSPGKKAQARSRSKKSKSKDAPGQEKKKQVTLAAFFSRIKTRT